MEKQETRIVLNCRQMFIMACSLHFLENDWRAFSDEAAKKVSTFSKELAGRMTNACELLLMQFISVEVKMQRLSQLSSCPLTFSDITTFVNEWDPMEKLATTKGLRDMVEECCVIVFQPILALWKEQRSTEAMIIHQAMRLMRMDYPHRFKRLPPAIPDPHQLPPWVKMPIPTRLTRVYSDLPLKKRKIWIL
jgi:hypothetical protein